MKSISFSLCLLIALYSSAQSSAVKRFRIGDTVPGMVVGNVINWPDSIIQLHFRKQYTILDFWNTTCSGTYEHLERIKNLNSKFGSRLQIVLVNRENVQTTKQFFKENKSLLAPVPIISNDSLLSTCFPFHSAQSVWIDSNGVVQYITPAWNLIESTIQKVLDGQKPALSQIQYRSHFVPDDPLLTTDNGRFLPSIDYYSFIGHCVLGIDIGNNVVNTNGKTSQLNRITQSCSSALDLFKLAYSESGKYNLVAPNSVIFERVDTSLFIAPPDTAANFDAWSQQHIYNYDLLIPEERSEQLYTTMQQDLCRYFNVRAAIEKRKINCYVLTTVTKNHVPAHANETLPPNGSKADPFFYIRKITMSDYAKSLAEIIAVHGFKMPLVNETGYDKQVSLKIPKSVYKNLNETGVQGLNDWLSYYGLKIVEKPAITNVLVFKPGRN